MVFYSSSRVPPNKIHCHLWRSPLLFSTLVGKNTTAKFLRRGRCKTMVFYSSNRVPPQKKILPDLEEPLVVFYPGGKKCNGEIFEGG